MAKPVRAIELDINRKAAAESELSTHQHKLQHNATSPINRIPLEMLTSIFLLTTVPANRWEENTFHEMYSSHLSITQVCHYWREAALGCPLFWREIQFMHVEWANELLERSHNVPLSVKISKFDRAKTPGLSNAVEATLKQLHRIQNLIIHQPAMKNPRCWELQRLEMLEYPAPLLQNLLLEGHSPKLPVTLSKFIFQGQAPQLSVLELANCAFEWDHFLLGLSSLVSLIIVSPATTPTITQLVSLFSRMPQLTGLHLESFNLLTTARTSSSLSSNKGRLLPSLKTLTLVDDLSSCTSLLSCLPIHPDVSLHLVCSCHPLNSQDLPLGAFLCTLWRQPNLQPIRYIQELRLQHGRSGDRAVEVIAHCDISTQLYICLELQGPSNYIAWCEWYKRFTWMLCSALPIDRMKKLEIALDIYDNPDIPNVFRDRIQSCTELKEICIDTYDDQAALFISALGIPRDTSKDDTSSSKTLESDVTSTARIPFSAVDCLRFKHFKLGWDQAEDLGSYLERRKDVGIPLKTLEVYCGYSRNDYILRFVERLDEEKIVENIELEYSEVFGSDSNASDE
ncbi:hypothetical protein AX16_002115 [Volvariella volvacea WC 439]|nr:hypothetical protein AX16_002115 [Volvariella volvacea WC 439]